MHASQWATNAKADMRRINTAAPYSEYRSAREIYSETNSEVSKHQKLKLGTESPLVKRIYLFFWPPLQVGADGQSLAAQSGLSSAEKDDQKSWKKYLNFERQRRCCKKRQRRLSCEMLQCCRPAMRCELLSKLVKYFAKHIFQSAAKYFRLVLQNCHSMSCKWSHHKNCCTDVRVKKRHW